MNIRLSLIQMEAVSRSVEENLDRAEKFVERAEAYRPHFLCLPEIFNAAVYYDRLDEVAETGLDGPTCRRAASWARRLNCVAVAGSAVEACEGSYFNSSFIFGPDGGLMGKYRKVHLFSPEGEDRHFKGGGEPFLGEHEGVRFGVMICYDLRFGGLAEFLKMSGADLAFVPARWPAVRRDHWSTLLKARAIETQAVFAGVNAVGVSPSLGKLGGASAAFDPWGKMCGELDGEAEGLLNCEFDLEEARETRRRIPLATDSRPELYRGWRPERP